MRMKIDQSAGDHSDEALVAAAKNYAQLKNHWCGCERRDDAGYEAYFRGPTGSHGWMCVQCQGITQTG